MAKLSTHVLDTTLGKPACGLQIKLYKRNNNQSTLIKTIITNKDGRCDENLLENEALKCGCYELEFDVDSYFNNNKLQSNFLKDVIIRFYINDNEQNYHVPLLISPYSYSTYKGS